VVVGLTAVLVIARGRSVGALRGALRAAIVAVCAYGVVDYTLGGRRIDQYEGTTLFEPIGYANGLAVFAAVGALLAAAFAVHERRPHRRAVAAGAFALAVATVALTRSRGGWLALAVGIVVALAFEGPAARRRLA